MPSRPTMDPICSNNPLPCARICGRTARFTRKTLKTLVSNCWRTCSRVVDGLRIVTSLFISREWICSTHGRELRKGCFGTAHGLTCCSGGHCCLCRRFDELHHVLRVGDHRHVARRDFDGGGTHTPGEQTLGIGRERLVIRGDQVPGWQRFPGRNTYHVLEGGRGQRLLHSVHDPGLHRVHVSRAVVHEVGLRKP